MMGFFSSDEDKNGTKLEQAFEGIQNAFTAETITKDNVHGYSLPSVIHCINQKQSLNSQVSLYGYALKLMTGSITVEEAVEDIFKKAKKTGVLA